MYLAPEFGLSSNWKNVRAGVPQGSVLSPLLFLIYISDLPRGLHADIKLFADDTLLFSVVDDIDESASKLNNDLIMIYEWAYRWKMSFNPDRTKPAHEVIFCQKNKNIYPNLYFNNAPIVKTTSQKNLGHNLDVKLTFNNHIHETICKAMKGFGLPHKLQYFLPCSSSGVTLLFEHSPSRGSEIEHFEMFSHLRENQLT